jgi:hypothetical protein
MSSTTAIPPFVAALGLLGMLFASLMFFFKRAAYQRCSKATGIIIGLVEAKGDASDGRTVTYSPKVSFQTVAGQQVEFVSSVSTFPAPVLGSKVTVLYDPNDLDDVTLDGTTNKYLFEMVIFGMGFIAILIWVIQQLAAQK